MNIIRLTGASHYDILKNSQARVTASFIMHIKQAVILHKGELLLKQLCVFCQNDVDPGTMLHQRMKMHIFLHRLCRSEVKIAKIEMHLQILLLSQYCHKITIFKIFTEMKNVYLAIVADQYVHLHTISLFQYTAYLVFKMTQLTTEAENRSDGNNFYMWFSCDNEKMTD